MGGTPVSASSLAGTLDIHRLAVSDISPLVKVYADKHVVDDMLNEHQLQRFLNVHIVTWPVFYLLLNCHSLAGCGFHWTRLLVLRQCPHIEVLIQLEVPWGTEHPCIAPSTPLPPLLSLTHIYWLETDHLLSAPAPRRPSRRTKHAAHLPRQHHQYYRRLPRRGMDRFPPAPVPAIACAAKSHGAVCARAPVCRPRSARTFDHCPNTPRVGSIPRTLRAARAYARQRAGRTNLLPRAPPQMFRSPQTAVRRAQFARAATGMGGTGRAALACSCTSTSGCYNYEPRVCGIHY